MFELIPTPGRGSDGLHTHQEVTLPAVETSLRQNEDIQDGVDFSKAQLDLYAAAYRSGMKTEFESVSPYAADYDLKNGKIWEDKLMHHDATGIEIAKTLRSLIPNARMISLYDEYNTGLPDSTNVRGLPEASTSQLAMPEETKRHFREDLKRVLEVTGVVNPARDRDGENYLLISESEKIRDAEALVTLLESKGVENGVQYLRRDGDAIVFVNPHKENPEPGEITLRSKSGRWMCEALDASSYVKPENKNIAHLVVLPAAFREQQHKVWEVLRVLGIQPINYHNIFYDPTVDPRRAAEIISGRLKDSLAGVLGRR